MASITIRRLDDALKKRLRLRAASNGRSMEEEARDILRVALATQPTTSLSLVESIRRKFEPLGFVELDIPPREPMPPPLKFDE